MSSWTRRGLVLVAIGLTGTACGAVKDEPDRDVMCNGAPVDVLPNGNFDALNPPWRQEPPSPSLLCGAERLTPDTSPLAGCLGGGADNSVTTLSQDIFLPEGASSAHLVGKICIATDETELLDNDVITFEILDGDVAIATLGRRTNQQGGPTCTFSSFTFDAPLTRDPRVATFRIQSRLDVGKPTSFYVDTLQLTVSCP